MSLVLEALRRVERPESKPGSVGVTVSSYRRSTRRTGFIPLLLGLITGAAMMLLLSPAIRVPRRPGVATPNSEARLAAPSAPPAVTSPASANTPSTKSSRSRSEVEPAAASSRTVPDRRSASVAKPSARVIESSGQSPVTAFLLQAISERDHHPVAVINDRLVKEGDVIGGARVLRIGEDWIDLLLENGKRETIHFPPPPPLAAAPSPSPN